MAVKTPPNASAALLRLKFAAGRVECLESPSIRKMSSSSRSCSTCAQAAEYSLTMEDILFSQRTGGGGGSRFQKNGNLKPRTQLWHKVPTWQWCPQRTIPTLYPSLRPLAHTGMGPWPRVGGPQATSQFGTVEGAGARGTASAANKKRNKT